MFAPMSTIELGSNGNGIKYCSTFYEASQESHVADKESLEITNPKCGDLKNV